MIYQKLLGHYDHCLYCLSAADHSIHEICVHILYILSYVVSSYFLLFWAVWLCRACPAVVPRCGSAVCGKRRCHTLNSNWNLAHNGQLPRGPFFVLIPSSPGYLPLFLSPDAPLSLSSPHACIARAVAASFATTRWCRTSGRSSYASPATATALGWSKFSPFLSNL